MSRPRRASDEELLDRIDDAATQRSSMAPWVLSDLAPAAGISPAGLIRRFGFNEGLLLALTRRWIDRVPDSPRGTVNALTERCEYVEENFATTYSASAVFGLGELMRDLWSPTSAELLREGWCKQAHYFATLLRHIPLRSGVDPHSASLALLDALHGSIHRRAEDLRSRSPEQALSTLPKGWT